MRTFTAETLSYRASDLRRFRRWPRSVVTGRFECHDGHFDPGQRLANIVMVLTLTTLLLTGVGALYLQRPLATVVYEVHRWSAFLITPVLAGHIIHHRVGHPPGLPRCLAVDAPRRQAAGGGGQADLAGVVGAETLMDRAAGTDRSGGYAIGAGSAEPGQRPGPDAGLGKPGVGSGPR